MVTCFTTIMVPVDQRTVLEELKVHPRQAYHEVIERLLQERFEGLARKRRKPGSRRRG